MSVLRLPTISASRVDLLGGLEASILPMLDNYAAEVVRDTSDLWSRWPAEP